MSNLLIRTITGALFITIVITATYFSFYSFLALAILIQILATIEFINIAKIAYPHINSKYAIASNICSFLIQISTFFVSDDFDLPLILLSSVPLLLIPLIELYRKTQSPLSHIGISLFPSLFLNLPLFCLLLSSQISPTYSHYNALMILGFFFIIWANDTGAYLTGISIGKHRLFERISPKKSWEGFFGGLLFANFIGIILSFYIKAFAPWQWSILATIIVVSGTYGDLIESMIKRSLSIKDSGSILPGHGGILDRFDSVLFAAPFYYIALKLFLLV